jgi:hypothetical protein
MEGLGDGIVETSSSDDRRDSRLSPGCGCKACVALRLLALPGPP